ncbi:ABC transporter ATP-binding protein [Corynebacterium sp. zg-331]|uniref:ABC transporter ATP-binding protein n=1 Tax=unclassified Corynebacterium TaxID=2624378 RepID=UPI00128D6565|nr:MULTISPECIES: ABC transporter ATP-binding protein [unclassified Corynebacterium]MBC3185345.1 ABC transporter ATP-binding protein [Corynebacterium sp. zg-331]MPV51842.1 ATP-binding cassette domain-containing protein [Corynebacterium sp. zg331]
MLQIKNLTKTYKFKRAVNDLSFTVPDGVVTGFLGPNGAGKSTTMRMAVGLERPTVGTATFDGTEFRRLAHPGRTVGTLLDATWFHPGRSARAHLGMMATLQQVSMRRVDDILERVGIASVAHKKVSGYSLGMRQRFGLACALLGDPKHLLLDEPINGLDPEGVHWMRDRIRELAAEGRSVLVSSHLLSEMALTADRLVVIGRGQLVREGTVDEFVGASGESVIEVRVDRPNELEDALAGNGIRAERGADNLLRVFGVEDPAEVGAVCRALDLTVAGLQRRAPSLEEAFLTATADATEYRSA